MATVRRTVGISMDLYCHKAEVMNEPRCDVKHVQDCQKNRMTPENPQFVPSAKDPC